MPILKGALGGRRYHVVGELGDNWQLRFAAALDENAFREPLSPTKKDETFGWVQVHNLLDTSFADQGRWLYNQYAVFALRVDKKVLPAKLFKAHLEKRQQVWCEAQKRDRCPPAVREELKETLEFEMLQQTLPRVQLFELVWNLAEGWVLFHNDSELPNDRFQKHFSRSFGLRAIPWLPTDELAERPELAEALLAVGDTDLRTGG